MAFGAASKVFARTVFDTLGRGTAVDWDSDTIKVALYGNTGTPDNTVATDALTNYNGAASQWVVANEVPNGSGYTSGGVAVTSPTLSQASATITYTSAGTPQWTSATFTAYGCLVYDSTVNVGLCFNSFGGSPQAVSSGTFTITWSGSGIASFAC